MRQTKQRVSCLSVAIGIDIGIVVAAQSPSHTCIVLTFFGCLRSRRETDAQVNFASHRFRFHRIQFAPPLSHLHSSQNRMDEDQLHHLRQVATDTENAWYRAAQTTLSDLTALLTNLHSLHNLQSPHHPLVPPGTTTDALSTIENAYSRLATSQRRLRASVHGVSRWLSNLPAPIQEIANDFMQELEREISEKRQVLGEVQQAMKGGPMPNYELVVAKWAEVNRRVTGLDLAAVIEARQLLQFETQFASKPAEAVINNNNKKKTSAALTALLSK